MRWHKVAMVVSPSSMLAGALALVSNVPAANSTDYLFRVSCSHKMLVAEWNTGDIDPGLEYLRVATGTKFPDCSVTDYNDAQDRDLPRERYSHEGGVIAGIPFVGPLICGIFGC